MWYFRIQHFISSFYVYINNVGALFQTSSHSFPAEIQTKTSTVSNFRLEHYFRAVLYIVCVWFTAPKVKKKSCNEIPNNFFFQQHDIKRKKNCLIYARQFMLISLSVYVLFFTCRTMIVQSIRRRDMHTQKNWTHPLDMTKKNSIDVESCRLIIITFVYEGYAWSPPYLYDTFKKLSSRFNKNISYE